MGAFHAPSGSLMVLEQAIVRHAIRSLTNTNIQNYPVGHHSGGGTGGAIHVVRNMHHIRCLQWRSSIRNMRPASTERLTELRQGTAACRPELDDTLQYELVRQHGVTLRNRWFTIMMNSLTFCLVFKLHDFVRVLIKRYPQDTLFRQIRETIFKKLERL